MNIDELNILKCEEGFNYLQNVSNFKEAWEKCERGDWLCYVIKVALDMSGGTYNKEVETLYQLWCRITTSYEFSKINVKVLKNNDRLFYCASNFPYNKKQEELNKQLAEKIKDIVDFELLYELFVKLNIIKVEDKKTIRIKETNLCVEGVDYLNQYTSLKDAWEDCENVEWLHYMLLMCAHDLTKSYDDMNEIKKHVTWDHLKDYKFVFVSKGKRVGDSWIPSSEIDITNGYSRLY